MIGRGLSEGVGGDCVTPSAGFGSRSDANVVEFVRLADEALDLEDLLLRSLVAGAALVGPAKCMNPTANTFGLDRLYHAYMITSSTGSGIRFAKGNSSKR